VCNGTLGNDISTFTDPSSVGGYSNFSKTVSAASSGGASVESNESVKFNAPKNYETQNRAVLTNDYKRIILRDNGDLSSVSVWGGEENNPPIYGKVYISVKPTNGTTISSTRKTQIKTDLKKYNVLSIDPEFVDATYLYIIPTITARFDDTATTLSAGAVQQKVLNAITSFETNNLGTFDNTRFRYSRFVNAIDGADSSIVGNETTIEIEKRFNPSTSITSTYNISFGNALHNPHAGHRYAIRSSSFIKDGRTSYLDDDGNGNVRIYYITGGSTRTYTNTSAGTVDYDTGLVTLNSFSLTSYTGDHLSIFADTAENDVIASRNQILLISGAGVTLLDDVTNVVAATTVTATTSGVTTTSIDPGLYPIVY